MSTTAAMWEKLGRLLWRVGRYGEARAAYQEGAAAADERLLAARCPYAAIGFLVAQGLQHQDEALSALDRAEKLLEHVTEKDSDEWVAAWLSVHEAHVELYYWRDTKQAEAVLTRNGPCWKQEVRRLNEHCFTRTWAMPAPAPAVTGSTRASSLIFVPPRLRRRSLGANRRVFGAEVAHALLGLLASRRCLVVARGHPSRTGGAR